MKRGPKILVVALLLVFPYTLRAQIRTPASNQKDDKSAAAKKNPSNDPGTRQLSRRERKDRIRNLPEKHRQFLTTVELIIQPSEVDAFLLLETDAQRDIYIEEFWRRRDPNPKTTYNEYRERYTEGLVDAKQLFRNFNNDRARVYLVRGKPAERLIIDCPEYLQPIEVWKYSFIEGMGYDQALIFYMRRGGGDFKLWQPIMEGLKDLLSPEGELNGGGGVFTPGIGRVASECLNGDSLINAIFHIHQNRSKIARVFAPPKVDDEDVGKILRAAVISNPDAPNLTADFYVAYPGRRGDRTATEITVAVGRNQLKVKDINSSRFYNVDLTGEVLKDGILFENFRYRYDFPVESAPEKLAIVVERFLRPAQYQARIKVTDMNSGAEVVVEKPLTVPHIEDQPDQVAREHEADERITELRQDFRVGESRLRIVPLPEDVLTGLQHIETIITGTAIKAVEFFLDGQKVMTKRSPPYKLDLDFGEVPRLRKIRAVGLGDKGQFVSGDEVTVNIGLEPFRVRIVSPRVALNLRGKVRVELDVAVPEGKSLAGVELFHNETRVATLYHAPYVQTIIIPENAGIGYIRAVASLKDEDIPPVEDLVFINTPLFLQEVDVHLVELPTTVVNEGKPVQNLPQKAFKVMDEGKPVELSKFEYVKNLQLSLGLAIDTSGSMRHRMHEAQKAGAKFFEKVLRPGDKAFVVAFDTSVQLVQKWSRELSELHTGLAALRAEETTALYDAVVYSLYNFQGVKGQKALVLITDGKDTASKFSFDQALEYARRAAVPIYAIGIGIRSAEIDARLKLSRFAAETGGNIYYIDTAQDLTRIYDDIEHELRSQYLLGFYPASGVKPGSNWREITVTVKGGKAKTIRGYYP